ncbi:glutathione synthase [Muricauda sp. NFXS6]|uniref:glutathione synthetase n=1 Tax=Allomuricauda sp. NFXS6 TaxID=2819094 RepID=UPI0032DF3D02
MRICFVLNKVATEANGTSIALMTKAHEMGHNVSATGVGGFNLDYAGTITIDVTAVKKGKEIKKPEQYLEALKSKQALQKRIEASSLDVLFIRNNPTEERAGREWAEHSGIAFGRMVQQLGVLVLNDAYALSNAFIDKLYFEELPKSIKPASIITRNKEDILAFWKENNKKMVLKPLEGSGGQNVYLIDENQKNLNQIISTLTAEGYIIAQEYLPEVKHGDVRVLLMNGKILEQDGKQAIIRRVSGKGEFRSNFSLGATADNSKLTGAMQHIVDITAPKLINDGLFFVGLDIVKDKLIEINVLSPGGLAKFNKIGLPDFTQTVIRAIERKLEFKKMHGNHISNKTLATMQ